MSVQPSPVAEHPAAPDHRLRVVIVGGGIAAAETALALRDRAGERVSLTLVCPNDELVLPAVMVAEPFALGHAPRYPLGDLLAQVEAQRVRGVLASIDPHGREILLQDGTTVGFDALSSRWGLGP